MLRGKLCLVVVALTVGCSGPGKPSAGTPAEDDTQPPSATQAATADSERCNELSACQAQCAGGAWASCNRLGKGLAWGVWGKQQGQAALAPLSTACEKDDWDACAVWAIVADDIDADTDAIPADAVHHACHKGRSWRACMAALDMNADTSDDDDDPESTAHELAVNACSVGDDAACVAAYAFLFHTVENEEEERAVVSELPSIVEIGDAACAGADLIVCTELLRDELADLPEAQPLLRRASRVLCKRGSGPACLFAAREAEERENPDEAAAAPYYVRACEVAGLGCTDAGQALVAGNHVAKDTPRGIALLDAVCSGPEQDERRTACQTLATLYDEGRDVPRDHTRAMTYWSIYCKAQLDRGCHAIAKRYIHGTRAPRDVAKGVELLERVCSVSESACWEAASLLYEGASLPADKTRAAGLLKKLCTDKSKPEACVSYGLMLENGIGVGKDRSDAETHYAFACNQSSRCGCVAYHRARKKRPNKAVLVTDCQALEKRGAKLPLSKTGLHPIANIGVPACDLLIDKLMKCLQRMPVAAQKQTRRAFEQTIAAWRQVPPANRKHLAGACVSAQAAWQKAFEGFGCTF